MSETPEQKARREIDAKLIASGWLVQDRDDLDLTAGRGIAVREFPMKSGFGFADYLLYVDRKALGAVEAKAEGTLAGVEAQSAKYAAGLPDKLSAHRRRDRRRARGSTRAVRENLKAAEQDDARRELRSNKGDMADVVRRKSNLSRGAFLI